jgi:uncharacterized protein (DUF2164 family)
MSENKLELNKEKKKGLIDEVKRFFVDQRGEEIGDLQAELLCDFLIEKVGVAVYNTAVTDARTWLGRRLADVEADFYSLEKVDKE